MQNKHTVSIRRKIVVIWVCCFPIYSLTGAAMADPGLADLFDQFKYLSSISYTATVEVEMNIAPVPAECICTAVTVPTGTPIDGYYEYRSTGDKYSVNSYLNPIKFPGMQTRVAYNDIKLQILFSNGTLALSNHDSATILAILPNPLLELLQFRYPITDENSHIQTRLTDVMRDSPPASFFDVTWETIPDASRSLRRATFPGGVYEGTTYQHFVYANASSLNKPTAIDRVAQNGDPLTSSEFSDYIRIDTAAASGYWPLSVVLHAFDTTGTEVFKASFALTNLEIDETLPENAFIIDTELAQRIWDDDAQVYIEP